MKQLTRQNIKKIKKLLIVVPLFFAVFAGVFYLAITAGNAGKQKKENQDSSKTAFNQKLPAANLSEKGKNKLEIYMQAQQDSARRKEEIEKDPYERRFFNPGPPDQQPIAGNNAATRPYPLGDQEPSAAYMDANERKAKDKLRKLYAAFNENTDFIKNKNEDQQAPLSSLSSQTGNVSAQQLETLLAGTQTGDSSDAQMKQIETVLNKLLEVQHPELVRERLQQKMAASKNHILPVSIQPGSTDSFLVKENVSAAAPREITQNDFFGLTGAETVSVEDKNEAILASIDQDQTVRDEGKVKLRLLQDVFIKDTRIPKDNFIYGKCTIGNERVYIRLENITFNNSIYPVQLTAFDTDGMEGLDAPGAIGRDVTKDGINQALSNLSLYNADPSFGAQAAAASIQTAKSLLSRKVKQVQATLKANHTVLLKGANTN